MNLWRNICNYVWWKPLEILYFEGPLLFGYGFWCNKNKADICADLTGIPSTHWLINEGPCTDLLENHFNAFAYGVTIFTYFGTIGVLLCGCVFRTCFLRPFIRCLSSGLQERQR